MSGADRGETWESFVARALSPPPVSDPTNLAERLTSGILETVLGDQAPTVHPDPPETIRLVRTVSLPVEIREAATVAIEHGIQTRSSARVDSIIKRLKRVSLFVPKSIREPYLGDLYEDLENEAAIGSSKTKLWWLVISQFGLLLLQRLISLYLRR